MATKKAEEAWELDQTKFRTDSEETEFNHPFLEAGIRNFEVGHDITVYLPDLKTMEYRFTYYREDRKDLAQIWIRKADYKAHTARLKHAQAIKKFNNFLEALPYLSIFYFILVLLVSVAAGWQAYERSNTYLGVTTPPFVAFLTPLAICTGLALVSYGIIWGLKKFVYK